MRDEKAPGILLPNPGRTTAVPLDEYRASGGYEGLARALARPPAAVIDEVKEAGLRGRGGAGFPTGLKWSFVPKAPGEKFLVVNADESEPGTFKDRELMEIEPHRLLEGIAIGAYAIGAEFAFVYIRGEYVHAAAVLEQAIADAEAAGLLGKGVLDSDVNVHVRVFSGAGAYICGEETALLESLEGNRPMPRARPPFPAVAGLYGRPTVVNNVETLANVPFILHEGAAAYKAIGNPPNNTGPKIFCLSGHVKRPGNYELALGKVTIRELIEDYGGGVPSGRPVKAVLPAGISAPAIPGDRLDALLDYDGVKGVGSSLGSASFIVLDDSVDAVWAAARMVSFFRHESCGKCTPCRDGTRLLEDIYLRILDGDADASDADALERVSKQMAGQVLCALGDFAANPVLATLQHFRSDYDERLVPLARASQKGSAS